jgi:hypothetical protein
MRHGDPVKVDYTPTTGNVAAGYPFVVGSGASVLLLVPHSPIANNVQGAAAVAQGIYECLNLNNAAIGAKVYWDATNLGASNVSTNNTLFGYVVENGGRGINTTCNVYHHTFY